MATRSISKNSTTYLPNTEDRRQLIDIKEALSDCDAQFDEIASQEDFPVAMLKVPGRDALPLTSELASVLMTVADQLSRNKAVFVAPYDTQLTTQDAADFLGISRPTLVKLLENEEIPCKRVGRHRRVLLADLQQYAERQHAKNIKLFDELSADEDPLTTLDNPLISQSE
ncbi:helix-turn-helix domain-containing protein [Bifidobacterium samirii]|uniref:helix-turn-helix domain-containing protein n=1 Tax=Bifidobacterium samirii TaxID=2306974 RepID=UPI000F7E5EC6|nr:helix-turn-helix domain-containing protein [Bifidobacterium samirii]